MLKNVDDNSYSNTQYTHRKSKTKVKEHSLRPKQRSKESQAQFKLDVFLKA